MAISFTELLTVLYVLVDDWYQTQGIRLRERSVGAKPDFSDSEMLTLMLAVDLLEFTSERRFRAFIQANYVRLFPQLLSQGQFNRRARALRFLLDALRQAWASQLGIQCERHFLLDTTPVPALGYRRDKTHSQFYGSAAYGYCAARRLKYFGYKLVLLTSLDGIPYRFELVPANTDERVAASTTYLQVRMCGQTKVSLAQIGKPPGVPPGFTSGRPNAKISTRKMRRPLTVC